VKEGGREVSIWWRDISALRSEEWFHGNVSQFVGDGNNILFWTGVWVGGMPFRERFTRLFVRRGAWSWRCRLFAWEDDMLGELRILLLTVTLLSDRVDRRV